jgi:NAD(P)-dependent dehydrogenase (short-subunit alcohol dehydrogenase family)
MRDLVVTGGSRGIGAAAHRRGYAVCVGYASADAAADRPRGELPGLVSVRADLADPGI